MPILHEPPRPQPPKRPTPRPHRRTEQEKLTLTILLLSDGKPTPHLLIFEGVHDYQISEKRVAGPVTLLSLKITEDSSTRSHLYLETNRGHRELYCTTAQIQTANLET